MNKQDKKNKKVNKNIKSNIFLKPMTFVLFMMFVVLMPLLFTSTTASAEEGWKQYVYSFELESGYVYQIITEENEKALKDRLNSLPSEDSTLMLTGKESAVFNSTGVYTSEDYLKITERTYSELDFSEYDEGASADVAAGHESCSFYKYAFCRHYNADEPTGKTYIKKILFKILDMSDDIAIVDVYNYRPYVLNDIDVTGVSNEGFDVDKDIRDDDFEEYYWGFWKEDFWGFKKSYKGNEDYMDYGSKDKFSHLKIKHNRYTELSVDLYDYLNNDINLVLLANCFEGIAVKSELKEGEIISAGDFSYEIKEDSINVKNKTVDIDVFYNDPKLGGSAKKIMTFRYGKENQAVKTIKTDNYVLYEKEVDKEKTLQLVPRSVFKDKNGKQVNPYGATATIDAILPRVVGNELYNAFDIAYSTASDKNDKVIHKANTNAGYVVTRDPKTEQPFVGSLQYSAYKNCMIPAAISRQNIEIIIMNNYGHIVESADNDNVIYEDCMLCHDLTSVNEPTEPLDFFEATTIFTIKQEVLDNIIKSKLSAEEKESLESEDFVLQSGNWKLTYDKNQKILKATNKDKLTQGEEKLVFDMKFTKDSFYTLYSVYYDVYAEKEKSYKVSLPKIENGENVNQYSTFYQHNNVVNHEDSNYAVVLISTHPVPSEITGLDNPFDRIVEELAKNSKQRILLNFFDPNNEQNTNHTNRGTEEAKIWLYDKSFPDLLNFLVDSNEEIVSFDITNLFLEEFKDDVNNRREKIIKEGKNAISYQMLDEEQLRENENKFYKALFKYTKPIMMFLILLIVLYTGIYSIMTNQDPKARALVKEKVKHILIGVIMFASIVLILWLCKSFMESSFDKIQDVVETDIETTVNVVEAELEYNWLVDIIASFIRSIREILEWIIDIILSKVVGNGVSISDPFALVFNTGIAIDYTLAPFTNTEWERYMYGYRALEALALALIALAIIKIAAEHVINAGNSEKIAESKQAILRMGIAMLCIILGPYIVRLILTLFNYLLLLVPLKNIDLDLQFGDEGIIGAIASFMFTWILFKIYLVFVIRKLMITFMLLLTPVVFGLWAVSSRFRSLSLWIGELITNAATQICYALVFFVASLIMFSGQSDFVTLIIVTMFIQLADFFKDSLQGLVQKWGGINETAIADSLAGGIKNVGRQGIRIGKEVTNFTGTKMQDIAAKMDPDGVSNTARGVHNMGAILRGDLYGIIGRSTTDKNKIKKLTPLVQSYQNIKANYDNQADMRGGDFKEWYTAVLNGEKEYDKDRQYASPEQKEAYELGDRARRAQKVSGALADEVKITKERLKDKDLLTSIQDNIKDNAIRNSENQLGDFESIESFKAASTMIGKKFSEEKNTLATKTAALDVLNQMKKEGNSAIEEGKIKEQIKEVLESVMRLKTHVGADEKMPAVMATIAPQVMEAVKDNNIQFGAGERKYEECLKDIENISPNQEKNKDLQRRLDEKNNSVRDILGVTKK